MPLRFAAIDAPAAGYTLLELLVVLSIMALLIAAVPGMALPVVNSVRFSGKVAAVTARLAAAHEQALQTGEVVSVTGAVLQDGDNITMSRPLTFYPDGSAAAASVSVMWLGRTRIIVVNPVTGIPR